MSNYPDNMNWYAYDDAYGEGSDASDGPTWDDVKEIARKHLEPAFKAMVAELDKLADPMGCYTIKPDDLKTLIDCTISDGVTDALHTDFIRVLNGDL